MGNSLRCCLACVIPCGALDLIRIVHLNGTVEELSGPVTAGEILEANPNHILSKPTSQGVVHKILILSPETELKRGSFYFLIPTASLPDKKKNPSKIRSPARNMKCNTGNDVLLLQEVAKKPIRKERRRRSSSSGSYGVWQPHLESISEDF